MATPITSVSLISSFLITESSMGHRDTVIVPKLYAITYDAMYNKENGT
jgi:hypothetical protein